MKISKFQETLFSARNPFRRDRQIKPPRNFVLYDMTKQIVKNSDHATNRVESDGFLLTKSQLAKRLNVSLRTIESWMAKRIIPYVKIKKTVRFVWADVEQVLKRNFGMGYECSATGSLQKRL